MSPLLHFLILPILVYARPQTDLDADYYPADFQPPPDICPLPNYLGFTGSGKLLNDCTTLNRYKEPPCNVYSYTANQAKVCCPGTAPLNPGDPGTADYVAPRDNEGLVQDVCGNSFITYDNPDEYDYYGLDEPPEPPKPEDACQANGSACKTITECSVQDFNNSTPPAFCGFDPNTGDDRFCCQSQGDLYQSPQAPLFPQQGQARPCQDHTEVCAKWVQEHPDSCTPSHPSYEFMRTSCQKSCQRCTDCVDNFANCPQWSRSGLCSVYPKFMIFNCRESCGSCGYRSPFNQEIQKVGAKQYTDLSRRDFTCGESKRRKVVNARALNRTNFENENRPYTYKDILDQNDGYTGALCSGTLISDRFVLTAAHCVSEFQAQSRKEVTRTVVIRDNTEYKEIFEVHRTFVHPLYVYPSLYYDIAVFELFRRVVFDYEIFGDSPPCLGEDFEIADQVALMQGVGITEEDRRPGVVLETEVETMSNEECTAWMRFNISANNYQLSLPSGITEQMLCTKGILDEESGIYSGPCAGDSGGPLYINGVVDDTTGELSGQTVAGIHSGALGCGHRNAPAWWQRVSSFAPWIKCIKENAQKGLSHITVTRRCIKNVKRFSSNPL